MAMCYVPAILWNDQRTQAECDVIQAKAGGLQALLKLTNNPMLTGYTGGKILWMREHEPELYAQIRYILNPKDYIRYRLTGEIATEVSEASGTGLFDVQQRRWCQPLLELLDIDQQQLPQCFESTEISGKISTQASADTGLPLDIPVVGGGGDAVVQTTGMGLITPGIVGTTLGTAGILAMGLDRYHDNDGRLQIFCNNSPNTWHVMGVNLVGGGAFRWLRDNLCELQQSEADQQNREVYELMSEAWLKPVLQVRKACCFYRI